MKFGPPSEETRRKISEATKDKNKNNASGKMGQYWKGKTSPNSKGLYCIGCHQQFAPSRADRHNKCVKEFYQKVNNA